MSLLFEIIKIFLTSLPKERKQASEDSESRKNVFKLSDSISAMVSS